MKHTLIYTIAAAATMLLMMMPKALNAQERDEIWDEFGSCYYQESNDSIVAAQKAGAGRPIAVLMGDSITYGWDTARHEFLEQHNIIGRGISGQCTAHMLVRFRPDVIDLHPKYVVIMGGINDIARNDGFSEMRRIKENIKSMCELARANKIKVVLATTTPTDVIGWRETENTREKVTELNNFVRSYAREQGFILADYAAALANEDGITEVKYRRSENDRIHLCEDGYKHIEPILLKAIGIKE